MSDSPTQTKDLSGNVKESIGNIQDQLATYGAQIQDYLKSFKADISDYKFAVEKTESGLDIDVRFKAQVKLSENETYPTVTTTPRTSTAP
jgi:hypothetical protein